MGSQASEDEYEYDSHSNFSATIWIVTILIKSINFSTVTTSNNSLFGLAIASAKPSFLRWSPPSRRLSRLQANPLEKFSNSAMLHRILLRKPRHIVPHRIAHDLESVFFVPLFICTHLNGPRNAILPSFGSNVKQDHTSPMKLWIHIKTFPFSRRGIPPRISPFFFFQPCCHI
jgi:hypothetical protein